MSRLLGQAGLAVCHYFLCKDLSSVIVLSDRRQIVALHVASVASAVRYRCGGGNWMRFTLPGAHINHH